MDWLLFGAPFKVYLAFMAVALSIGAGWRLVEWIAERRDQTANRGHDYDAAIVTPKVEWVPKEEWYGEAHKAERAKYTEVIRLHGGQCMEKVCIMPTRRIAAGARWHLAHDHERGGQHDYLGPAHPECNEREAKVRRGEWVEPTGDDDRSTWADDFEGTPLPVGAYTGVIRRWDPHFMTGWDGTFNWAYTYEVSTGKFAGRKQVERIVIGSSPYTEDGRQAHSLEQMKGFTLSTSSATQRDLTARFAAIGEEVDGIFGADPEHLIGATVAFRIAPRPKKNDWDQGWPYKDTHIVDVEVLDPPPATGEREEELFEAASEHWEEGEPEPDWLGGVEPYADESEPEERPGRAGLQPVETSFHIALLDADAGVGVLVVPSNDEDVCTPDFRSIHEMDNEDIKERLRELGWVVESDHWAEQVHELGRYGGLAIADIPDGRQVVALIPVADYNAFGIPGDTKRHNHLVRLAMRLPAPAEPVVDPADYVDQSLPTWAKHLRWIPTSYSSRRCEYAGRTVTASEDGGFYDVTVEGDWRPVHSGYGGLRDGILEAARRLPPVLDSPSLPEGLTNPGNDWATLPEYCEVLAAMDDEDADARFTVEAVRLIGIELPEDVKTFRDLRSALEAYPSHRLVSRTLHAERAALDLRAPEEPTEDNVPAYESWELSQLLWRLRDQHQYEDVTWPDLQAELHWLLPDWVPATPIHKGDRLAEIIEVAAQYLDPDTTLDPSVAAAFAFDTRVHIGTEPPPEWAVWRVDYNANGLVACNFFIRRADAYEASYAWTDELSLPDVVHIASERARRIQLKDQALMPRLLDEQWPDDALD